MAKINENYVHSCNCPAIAPKNYICALSDAGYTDSEFREILGFYVLNAPILKSGRSSEFGKSLKDYGWCGNSKMTALERKLLKVSEIPSFCFIRADSIDNTLEQMQLGKGNWCVTHPRAVLKQNCKAKLLENGEVDVTNDETRMECLFRHIRNSLAHNHTYVFENGSILLEDADNQRITARILLKKYALLDWIRVVRKETSPNKQSEQPLQTDAGVQIA